MRIMLIWLVLASLFNSPKTFNIVQDENERLIEKFQTSFGIYIQYPSFLAKNCIATTAYVKIDIDEHYKVSGIHLSDSADILYKVELAEHSKKLNFAVLETYCRNKQIKSQSLMMPVFVSFGKAFCSPVNNQSDILSLQKFEKKPFSGKATYLAPYVQFFKDISYN